ncbi:MAG: hypothetical protein R2747_22065 [Pyrinomonadaceae bacterium]
MNEPDQIWERRLNEAIRRAEDSGRSDVAAYISLKSANDSVRITSVKWLLETVLEIVSAFNERGARILVEQKEDHGFDHEKARLTGSFLKLQQGVRCLTLEAGWTRNPGDGFMRGGALAFARIKHFGFPKEGENLVLLRFEGAPQWFSVADERRRISFNVQSLRRHFEIFMGAG